MKTTIKRTRCRRGCCVTEWPKGMTAPRLVNGEETARGRQRDVLIFNGRATTLEELAEELEMAKSTLRDRLKHRVCLQKPVRKAKPPPKPKPAKVKAPPPDIDDDESDFRPSRPPGPPIADPIASKFCSRSWPTP